MNKRWAYAVASLAATAATYYVFRDFFLSPYSVTRVADFRSKETTANGEQKIRYGRQAVVVFRKSVSEIEMTETAQNVFDDKLRATLNTDVRYEFGVIFFPTDQIISPEKTTTTIFPVAFERVNGDWKRVEKKK
jgi:hypothetical protein